MASIASLISGSVQGVTFRSQVTPDYTYDPNAPAPAEPQSSWLMQLVKPEVTLQTPLGPMRVAPYGVPTQDYFPILVIGGIALLVGAFTLAGWIGRVTAKK
jgi:hypothetical protein